MLKTHDKLLKCRYSWGHLFAWRKFLCFVWFVCHGEISQATVHLTMFLVPLENFGWMNWGASRWFLDLEYKNYWIFFIENSIKLKVKMLEKLMQAFCIIRKDLVKINLKVILQVLDLRWSRYWILNHFYDKKSI